MQTQELRRAHRSRPFCPFTIHIADGRHFRVPHPELMLFLPGDRTVIVVDDDGAAEFVETGLVTSLTRTDHRTGSDA